NGMGYEARSFNDQGLEMSRNGSYTEALKLFDQALELDPQSIEILENKAETQYLMGNPQAALDSYEAILDRKSNSSEILYKKGIMLEALGRYNESLIIYETSLEEFDVQYSQSSGQSETFSSNDSALNDNNVTTFDV
ncbi:MAG TPA: tetratricopeptide repeat protein, partial [Methanomethylovorans sp.]|nr:tetratricopeptide repeat protein [Methanomethylovorans sp.]